MAEDDDKLAGLMLPLPEGALLTQLGPDLIVLDFPMPTVTMPPELTSAEQEVALLVFEGATNEQIARARSSSVKTVGNQLGSIFRKLDVCSRVELVLYLQGRSDA